MLLARRAENETDGFLLHAATNVAAANTSAENAMTVRVFGIARFFIAS